MTTQEHGQGKDPPSPQIPFVFDPAAIAARRQRAVARGEVPDFLLQRVADDFAERLLAVRRTFPVALNIGFGCTTLATALRAVPSIQTVFNAEVSGGPSSSTNGVHLVASEEAMPVGEQTLDLAVSALSLQLINDLPGAFVQLRQALRPDGLMLAALLGGATLHELREAFLAAEIETTGGASPRVALFADVRSLGGLLQRTGFALPVIDSDTVTVTYKSPIALMHDVRAMGASNPLHGRSRAPLRRGILFRAIELYQDRFGLPDGRIPATFEIITLTAWAPDASQPKPLKPGSAQTHLSQVLKPRL